MTTGVDASNIPLAGHEKFTDAMEKVLSKVEMRTRDDPFGIYFIGDFVSQGKSIEEREIHPAGVTLFE